MNSSLMFEMRGAPVKDVMKSFYDESTRMIEEDMEKNKVMTDHGTDILYDKVVPRIKWFKPPYRLKIWKFTINMGWAYKTVKSYLFEDMFGKDVVSNKPIAKKAFVIDTLNTDTTERRD